jgi:hypothetical protein
VFEHEYCKVDKNINPTCILHTRKAAVGTSCWEKMTQNTVLLRNELKATSDVATHRQRHHDATHELRLLPF